MRPDRHLTTPGDNDGYFEDDNRIPESGSITKASDQAVIGICQGDFKSLLQELEVLQMEIGKGYQLNVKMSVTYQQFCFGWNEEENIIKQAG